MVDGRRRTVNRYGHHRESNLFVFCILIFLQYSDIRILVEGIVHIVKIIDISLYKGFIEVKE